MNNSRPQFGLSDDFLSELLKSHKVATDNIKSLTMSPAFEAFKKEASRINEAVKSIRLPDISGLTSVIEEQKFWLKKRDEILNSISIPKITPSSTGLGNGSRSTTTPRNTTQLNQEGVDKMVREAKFETWLACLALGGQICRARTGKKSPK